MYEGVYKEDTIQIAIKVITKDNNNDFDLDFEGDQLNEFIVGTKAISC